MICLVYWREGGGGEKSRSCYLNHKEWEREGKGSQNSQYMYLRQNRLKQIEQMFKLVVEMKKSQDALVKSLKSDNYKLGIKRLNTNSLNSNKMLHDCVFCPYKSTKCYRDVNLILYQWLCVKKKTITDKSTYHHCSDLIHVRIFLF